MPTDRRYFAKIAAFELNAKANVAVMFALTAPILLGFAGLGIDASIWARAKNNAQDAADQAALAVAAAAVAGAQGTTLNTEARGVAAANGFVNGQNGVTVAMNNP